MQVPIAVVASFITATQKRKNGKFEFLALPPAGKRSRLAQMSGRRLKKSRSYFTARSDPRIGSLLSCLDDFRYLRVVCDSCWTVAAAAAAAADLIVANNRISIVSTTRFRTVFLVPQSRDIIYCYRRNKNKKTEMGFTTAAVGGALGFAAQCMSNSIQKIPLSRRKFPLCE